MKDLETLVAKKENESIAEHNMRLQLIAPKPREGEKEYLLRLSKNKSEYGLSWDDICRVMNHVTGKNNGESAYRKRASRMLKDVVSEIVQDVLDEVLDETANGIIYENVDANLEGDGGTMLYGDLDDYMPSEEDEEAMWEGIDPDHISPIDEKMLKLRKQEIKARDERNNVNAMLRRMTREETLIEMADVISKNVSAKRRLKPYTLPKGKNLDKEGILVISDWHYGNDFSTVFNTFNPEIARQRINLLRDKTIDAIKKEELTKLYVLNLGDMIAGRIHAQLRINSRFDVITQCIEVTELLIEFLHSLSEYAQIEYYDALDNHSRLEPNLKESLDLETLCRITTWVLKREFENHEAVTINDNTQGDDIITLTVLGHNIAAVHGHRDKPQKLVQGLSGMTKTHYSMIIAGHYHHFNADEINETAIFYNGSLMGTDDYAVSLRCNSRPEQTMLIVKRDNPAEVVYKFYLD